MTQCNVCGIAASGKLGIWCSAETIIWGNGNFCFLPLQSYTVWTFIATAVHSGNFPVHTSVSTILVIDGHVWINSNWPWHHTFQGVSLRGNDQRLLSWSVFHPLYHSYKHIFNLLLLCEAALWHYCFDLAINAATFLCFCTGNSTGNR